jgi:hypothetical protein
MKVAHGKKLFIYTWLAKPTPTPRRRRPMMSMATSLAAPLIAAPARKTIPPPNMDHLRPNALVTFDAKNEATNAARYRDDVKRVNNPLSNLQYWFVLVSNFSLWYTEGKKLDRKESMDVTPPTRQTCINNMNIH